MKLGPLEPHFWIAMHRYFCVSEDYGKILKSAGEPSFTPKKKNQLGAKTLQFSDNSMAESDIRHRNWDIACFSWSGTFHINCFAHLRPFSYHSLIILFDIYSMDWCKGNVTGKPHDLHGKIYGVRLRFSQQNQSVGSWDDGHIPIWPWCPFAPSNPLMVEKKQTQKRRVSLQLHKPMDPMVNPIYHHRNLLFYRGVSSNKPLVFHQPMGSSLLQEFHLIGTVNIRHLYRLTEKGETARWGYRWNNMGKRPRGWENSMGNISVI